MKFIDLDTSLGVSGICTQLDVLTLEAYMLYPNDEAARREARTTTGIEFVKRHHNLLPADFFRDIFSMTFDAKSLPMVQGASRDRFTGGIIAGRILHHALGTKIEGLQGNSVSYAVSRLSEIFGPGYSKPTIHNLWRQFKKVSHYWAAYISAGLSDNNKAPPFPCTDDSLGHFLATARVFLELGQTTRAWKSPEATILPPNECLELHCGFDLPALANPPPIFYFSKSL